MAERQLEKLGSQLGSLLEVGTLPAIVPAVRHLLHTQVLAAKPHPMPALVR